MAVTRMSPHGLPAKAAATSPTGTTRNARSAARSRNKKNVLLRGCADVTAKSPRTIDSAPTAAWIERLPLRVPNAVRRIGPSTDSAATAVLVCRVRKRRMGNRAFNARAEIDR